MAEFLFGCCRCRRCTLYATKFIVPNSDYGAICMVVTLAVDRGVVALNNGTHVDTNNR